MGESVRFDPDVLREIIWQGMTNEEYRNTQELEEEFDEAQELIEEVFDEGISCVLLLLVALAIFVNEGAGGEDG